ERQLSTKTVADVVESLIGASYADGGLARALRCVSVFIPQLKWRGLAASRRILYDAAPADLPLPDWLRPLEELLGHRFPQQALLVQAATPPSCAVPPDAGGCLDRLEFVGDALLDYVVVRRLWAGPGVKGGYGVGGVQPPSHMIMHRLRAALVNQET